MYIINRKLDNYKNIEVENFDPSLVPVSSIVTLAKVAQKLVDGGGTLTNPGNLRITGNQQIDGNLNLKGNVVELNSELTNIGDQTKNSYTLHTPKDGRRALFISPRKADNSGWDWDRGIVLDYNNNTATINGNTSVNGNLTSKGAMTLQSDDRKNGFTFFAGTDPNNGGGVINDTLDLHSYQNGAYKNHVASFGNNGSSTFYGNVNVGQNLNASGNISSSGSISATGNLDVNGSITNKGNINMNQGTVLYNNGRMHINGEEILYILNKNGVNISKNWGGNGNLNVDGEFTSGTISHKELLELKLLLRFMIWNTPAKYARYMSPDIPCMGIDGWPHVYDSTGYFFPVGDHSNLHKEWNYINNYQAGAINTTDSAGDRMNYILLYPGYGFKGWTNVGFVNDNNENGNNPVTFENRTNGIMYYSLATNYESSDENLRNYGMNLWDKLPWAPFNIWDRMSSCKVYKL